jgi:1-acyl-sn-glycerol-3-phosphate acyltransferase
LDRENRRKGIESIKRAGDFINQGRSVVVFPEGTRSTDGQIKKFKKGSLLIAANTKAPVVPLTINGSFRIMSKKSFRLHPGKVKIVISPPIKTEDLTRSEQKELSERVRKIIIDGMAQ